MRTYKGRAINIGELRIGKITRGGKGVFERKNYVLLTDSNNVNLWGYLGVVSTGPMSHMPARNKKPMIQLDQNLDLLELHEDDVVALDSSGQISVLWEANSSQNSILATERCNCKCLTCPQVPVKEDRFKFEDNLRILELVDPKSTHHIGITGGEPTLVGDKLLKLMKICRDRFDQAIVSLLTNGRRFSDFELARQLAEINHPNLLICVSLNADTDSQHDYILGAKNSFREAVEGIRNLALFKQKIEIRVVVQALNYERLPQLADYIYRNFPFVCHIAFMGMEVCGLAVENIDQIWVDPYDYQNHLQEAVVQLHRRMMNVSIYNVPLCLLPRELWGFARQSISTWKNIYLPICEQCSVKGDCCGIFSTSGEWQSKRIAPVQAAQHKSSNCSSDFA